MITTPATTPDSTYEDTPRRPPIPGLALWLLILCLMMLIVPLYLLAMTLKEQRAPQSVELTALSATLAVTPALPAEQVELNESLMGTLNEARSLSDTVNTLQTSHVNYPDLMLVLLNFDATLLQIVTIQEQAPVSAPIDGSSGAPTGGLVQLSGEALSESVVRAYTDELRRQSIIQVVTVQSLETVTADESLSLTALPPVSMDATLAAPVSVPVRRFIPTGNYVRFTLLIQLVMEGGES